MIRLQAQVKASRAPAHLWFVDLGMNNNLLVAQVQLFRSALSPTPHPPLSSSPCMPTVSKQRGPVYHKIFTRTNDDIVIGLISRPWHACLEVHLAFRVILLPCFHNVFVISLFSFSFLSRPCHHL
jgi:hypothetical protein